MEETEKNMKSRVGNGKTDTKHDYDTNGTFKGELHDDDDDDDGHFNGRY